MNEPLPHAATEDYGFEPEARSVAEIVDAGTEELMQAAVAGADKALAVDDNWLIVHHSATNFLTEFNSIEQHWQQTGRIPEGTFPPVIAACEAIIAVKKALYENIQRSGMTDPQEQYLADMRFKSTPVRVVEAVLAQRRAEAEAHTLRGRARRWLGGSALRSSGR